MLRIGLQVAGGIGQLLLQSRQRGVATRHLAFGLVTRPLGGAPQRRIRPTLGTIRLFGGAGGRAGRRVHLALAGDIKLPVGESTGIVGQLGVLQRPDPGGQRGEQCPVVGHQHDGSLIVLQGVFQRLDRFHVEVVGRLVEHQQVRVGQHHQRECDARAFTAGQRAGATLHLAAREIEPAEMPLNLAAIPHRPPNCDQVVERRGRIHVTEILAVVGNGDRRHQAELATIRGALADQRLEQRRLAGPVRSDQSDNVFATDHAGPRLEQLARPDVHFELLGHQHLVAAALARGECHCHRPVGTRRR